MIVTHPTKNFGWALWPPVPRYSAAVVSIDKSNQEPEKIPDNNI